MFWNKSQVFHSCSFFVNNRLDLMYVVLAVQLTEN